MYEYSHRELIRINVGTYVYILYIPTKYICKIDKSYAYYCLYLNHYQNNKYTCMHYFVINMILRDILYVSETIIQYSCHC